MLETPELDSPFARTPMRVIRRLQAQAPVTRAVKWGNVPVWWVTRYEEANALLADRYPRRSTPALR